MRRLAAVALCLAGLGYSLILLQNDETVSAYGAADRVWRLTDMDGTPVTFAATLHFPKPGTIAGETLCATFAGSMTVPYPWFDASDLSVTSSGCPQTQDAIAFQTALQEMSLSEVLGDTLILSTPQGRRLVFKSGE